MNALKSVSISTDGESPGYFSIYRGERWHQVDTATVEDGVETWGCTTRALAIFEDPFVQEATE